eukprot:3381302-Rhodomonas_salina.1
MSLRRKRAVSSRYEAAWPQTSQRVPQSPSTSPPPNTYRFENALAGPVPAVTPHPPLHPVRITDWPGSSVQITSFRLSESDSQPHSW